MRIIGFGGPSIDFELIESTNVTVQWLPPAGLGDLLSAVQQYMPDVVVLADIRPWPSLSVWHKELLWALAHGIYLVGTGAGGAIRAAELFFCGMRGHGKIFEMYKDGRLEDDAAVLCKYERNQGTCKRLTEPFVNIAATLAHPWAEDVLSSEEKEAVLHTAKEIFFEERTRDVLLDRIAAAGLASNICQKVKTLLKEAYVDQQALDVRDTLQRLADPGYLGDPPSPETIPIPVTESTTLFRNLYDRDRTVKSGSTNMRLYEMGDYITTHCDTIETDSYNALNRELALVLAEKIGMEVTDAEVDTSRKDFRRQHQLQADTDWQDWLQANDINTLDMQRMMREEALVRKLHAAFFVGHMYQRNTRPILDFMRLQNTYTTWREKAFAREEKIVGGKNAIRTAYLNADFEQLLYHKQTSSPLPWRTPVQPAADALGMSAKSFIIELIKDQLSESDLDDVFLEKLTRALD